MNPTKKHRIFRAQCIQNRTDEINQKLNDDCLVDVFKYLPLLDKLTIEQVCKRWKRLSKLSWSNINVLIIDNNFLIKNLIKYSSLSYRRTFFATVICRCKNRLRQINITLNYYDPVKFPYLKNNKEIFNSNLHLKQLDADLEKLLMANNELEVLHLENVELKGKCFTKVSEKLKQITLKNVKIEDTKYLYDFLKSSKNIKKLDLISCSENFTLMIIKLANEIPMNVRNVGLSIGLQNGKDVYNIFEISVLLNIDVNTPKMNLKGEVINQSMLLSLLGELLESLTLRFTRFNENTANIFIDLAKYPKLDNVTLDFIKIRDKHAKAISDCSNLKILSLNYVKLLYLSRLGEKNFEKLQNLEEISLFNSELRNDFLLALSKCKKLKIVNIANCNNITDAGLKHIITSVNLEKLVIKNLDTISNEIFNNSFMTLEELIFENCKKITNNGITKLLENAPNLKILKLIQCCNITKFLLDGIIKTANIRGENVKLGVNITGITNKQINSLNCPYVQFCK